MIEAFQVSGATLSTSPIHSVSTLPLCGSYLPNMYLCFLICTIHCAPCCWSKYPFGLYSPDYSKMVIMAVLSPAQEPTTSSSCHHQSTWELLHIWPGLGWPHPIVCVCALESHFRVTIIASSSIWFEWQIERLPRISIAHTAQGYLHKYLSFGSATKFIGNKKGV